MLGDFSSFLDLRIAFIVYLLCVILGILYAFTLAIQVLSEQSRDSDDKEEDKEDKQDGSGGNNLNTQYLALTL